MCPVRQQRSIHRLDLRYFTLIRFSFLVCRTTRTATDFFFLNASYSLCPASGSGSEDEEDDDDEEESSSQSEGEEEEGEEESVSGSGRSEQSAGKTVTRCLCVKSSYAVWPF